MEAIVERCAGLDVHQATVVACVISGPAGKKPKKETRTFGTMHHELMQLRDWLKQADCTLVEMESTGVYWKPVHALIEGEQSPAEMAKLARGRMRNKLTELEHALRGDIDEHHRFILRLQFGRIKGAEADLAVLEQRIEEKLAPYEEVLRRLLDIP